MGAKTKEILVILMISYILQCFGCSASVLVMLPCPCLVLFQNHSVIAQYIAQATCALGPPVSSEQREKPRLIKRAHTSAALQPWAVYTLIPSLRPTERSRSSPQSSSLAVPWMASSHLQISGMYFLVYCGNLQASVRQMKIKAQIQVNK